MAIPVAAALTLAGCAGVVRERIYHPVPIAETALEFLGEAPAQTSVTTADGLTLSGYYWAPETGNDTVVVYFHGNGFNQLVGAARAEPLRTGGHGVLVASYRGYGGNPGSPSEEGLFADGDAWIAQARRLAPDARLFLFGHSLGGAVALEMAARYDTDGVATLGAFSRLSDVAPSIARGFLPDSYDNLSAITRVDEPMLLLHGTQDQTVPFANAERLRAANPSAVVVSLPGAGHHVNLELVAERLWSAWQDPADVAGPVSWQKPTADE